MEAFGKHLETSGRHLGGIWSLLEASGNHLGAIRDVDSSDGTWEASKSIWEVSRRQQEDGLSGKQLKKCYPSGKQNDPSIRP